MPKIEVKEDNSTKTMFLTIGAVVFGVSCIFLVGLAVIQINLLDPDLNHRHTQLQGVHGK